uniref:C-type lectin domain-containing protein n=1 Tax=Anabas testudineus TaxID=64144 RepID=A0A3Q1HGB4_ANATE
THQPLHRFCLISPSHSYIVPVEYHYVNLSLTWTDAQSYCRGKYTDLVTIESMDDISRLNSLNMDISYAWIGLTDDPLSWKGVMANDVNSWRWTATGKTNVNGYQFWASGQPNNANGNQFCVVMNSNGASFSLGCPLHNCTKPS